MDKYILALDQGTTSSRAIVFGRDGRIVSSAQQEFEQILPGPGLVEHDPEAILQRLRASGLSVTLVDNASVVSVVGSRLLQQPWVAGRALEALGRRDISLKGIVSPSEHSVCVVIDREDHDRALAILHEALMLTHLANRAADAVRRKLAFQGDDHGTTSIQGRGDRSDGNRRTAARSPAA